MPAKRIKFVGEKNEDAEEKQKKEDAYQCWKQTFESVPVKRQETEPSFKMLLIYNTGNKIAGNDKKDVNTNKSARQGIGKGMIDHDQYNCDGSQPVYIWTIQCNLFLHGSVLSLIK